LIKEKFPEDFDFKDELKFDNQVYKYTGEDFDVQKELKTDEAF
jgi:hypothetical protein